MQQLDADAKPVRPTESPCDPVITPRRKALYLAVREGVLQIIRAFDVYHGVPPLESRRTRER